MKSIGKKLELLSGMCGTKDLNDWENRFVADNFEKYRAAGKSTSGLSDKVVEKIDDLYRKHFG